MMNDESSTQSQEPPTDLIQVTGAELISHFQSKQTAWIVELVMQKAFDEITEAAIQATQQSNQIACCSIPAQPSPKQKILNLGRVREYLALFGVDLSQGAQQKCEAIEESQLQQTKHTMSRDIMNDILQKMLQQIQFNDTKPSYYTVITTQAQVEKLCDAIMMQGQISTPVIGVDCEGFSKNKNSIAMIQIAYRDHSYLFDLKEVDPFSGGKNNLLTVLQSSKVTKIFHDFCEDGAALQNFYGIVCQKVFDTQIAHRIIQDATMGSTLISHRDDYKQISLNELLFYYLGAKTQNTQKSLVAQFMRSDQDFWHNQKRPLSQGLLEYAAQDVLFLPQVFECMRKHFLLPYNDKYINPRTGQQTIHTVTIQAKIMSDSQKFQLYPKINKQITQPLEVGQTIEGFIKNYRGELIFCSLNLGGVSGVIKDHESIKLLQCYHQFGDIVTLQVCRFEQRKQQCHTILQFRREIQSYMNNQQQQDFLTKTATLNVAAAEFMPQQIFGQNKAAKTEQKDTFSHLIMMGPPQQCATSNLLQQSKQTSKRRRRRNFKKMEQQQERDVM